MNTNKSLIFLILIILVASFLRLYKLGDYPIHLTNDEAGLGYNAYSIIKTARDEHGNLMPVIFKSFGDWKPGLYVYLATPFVAVSGLTEVSVRLPSALLGILAVYLLYKITKELFDNNVALFTSVSLAILPWHTHFSRGAWEGNVAVTLILLGIWFFTKSISRNRYLILSAVAFGLSLWTYQSMKLMALLVVLALVITYRKEIFSLPKKVLTSSFTVGLLISLPIILSLVAGKGGRIAVMSVFSYTRPEEYIEENILSQEDITKQSSVYFLFHSEPWNIVRGITGRYFNYMSGRFLFFEGDWSSPRHSEVDMGYLLYADIAFLILGIYGMIRRSNKSMFLVLLLLVVSPIPSVLTRDSVQGIRALPMVIPLSIIIGFGINYLFNLVKSKNIFAKGAVIFLTLAGILYSLFLYMDAYYIQTPKIEGKDYFYGYKQVIDKIDLAKYNKIVFTQGYDQPYIFFLFYGVGKGAHISDPNSFQKNNSFVENRYGDVGLREHLGNIEFRSINWSSDRSLKNTLLVGKKTDFPPEEIYNGEYKVDSINYLNGDTAFIMVEGR